MSKIANRGSRNLVRTTRSEKLREQLEQIFAANREKQQRYKDSLQGNGALKNGVLQQQELFEARS